VIDEILGATPQVALPMMATVAAAIMNGALALHLLDSHTVTQIDKLASAFGGTVILRFGTQLAPTLLY